MRNHKGLLLFIAVAVITVVLCQVTVSAASQSDVGYPAGSRLNILEKNLYNQLKTAVLSVANGSSSSTTFTITSGLSDLTWTQEELGCTITSNGAITTAAQEAVSDKLNEAFSLNRIMNSLLADCPYELYWFDKTAGLSYTYGMRESASSKELYITKITFKFRVSADYRASEYQTNPTKTAAAARAMTEAKAVVAKHASKSDAEKLNAYREEICSLVSYNHAALTENRAYGDPWQLIYVFDEDPATNVVCEGYSKAFKLLCDLSTFSGDIYCYMMVGTFNPGDGDAMHMWNVVSINGKRYLVDLTNCDEGTIGGLFLLGGKTSNTNQTHIVTANGQAVTYTSFDTQRDLFCDGFLTLSGTSYAEDTHIHSYGASWQTNGTYHWRECACGEKTAMAAHSSIGANRATCTKKAFCDVCAIGYGTTLEHSFVKQMSTTAYLQTSATCVAPARYYYSCACGTRGTTTYEHGSVDLHHHIGGTKTTYAYIDNTQHVTHTICVGCDTTIASSPAPHTSGSSDVCTECGGDVHLHRYVVQAIQDEYLATAATCTTSAQYYYSCSCGARGKELFEHGDRLAHLYTQTVTTEGYLHSSATCTAAAMYYYSCLCGAPGTETFAHGPLLDHQYSAAWMSDGAYHWHACVCGSKADLFIHVSIGSNRSSCTKRASCNVCEAEYGEFSPHAYNNDQSNHSHHWQECSCGATTVAEEHTDQSGSGLCNVCGWTMNTQSAGEEKDPSQNTNTTIVNKPENEKYSVIGGASFCFLLLLVLICVVFRIRKKH